MNVLLKLRNLLLNKHSVRYYKPGDIVGRLQNYNFVKASEEHVDLFVKFLGQHHYVQIPTLRCLGADGMEIAEEFRDDTVQQLKQGLAFYVEDASNKEVVGVSIAHMMSEDLEQYFSHISERFADSASYPHWRLFQELYSGVDVYRHYGVKEVFHSRVYTLHPRVQGIGLGVKYLEVITDITSDTLSTLTMDKLVATSESNGYLSNAMSDRLNFINLKQINYQDFELEGERPFREVAIETRDKFVSIRTLVYNLQHGTQ